MTESGGLGSRAARGAFVTFGGQGVRIVVQLASVTLLARLLEPSDYGVVVMVTALIGVAEIFRDFGLSSAAIQTKVLSVQARSNLFWLNTGLGFLLTLLVFGSSWPIAAFYGDERLVPITQVLSVTFLLNGMSTQYRASLNRSMRFGALVIVDVISVLIALLVAVSAAIGGLGYWALVAQQLLIPIVGLGVLLVVSKWLPMRARREPGMASLVKYGLNVSGSQVLVYLGRNFDSIWIGNQFGASALGFYDRAFQLLMLPLNQINAPATKVALPVLSRLQDQPARYDAFLLRGQSILLNVIVPIFIFATATAEVLVPIVLGNQWAQSVVLFQILAVGGLARAAAYATYWVALSKNLTRISLLLALVTTPMTILAIIIGSLWGVTGVAVGVGVTSFVSWPLGLWWYGLKSDAPVLRVFFAGLRTMTAWALPGFIAYLAIGYLDGLLEIWRLLIAVAIFLTASAAVALIWPAFRRDVIAVISTARMLRKKK
jgi:PST family polysaccharide transporter